MSVPHFYVVARVVGSPGAFPKWKERLGPLCQVSATERHGVSYLWGQDIDGEPDTLWGLEGYSHATGFFMGHPASDIFKREMALVDGDQLLKHEQGLTSKDYDLHHYDLFSGWLRRTADPSGEALADGGAGAHVAVYHIWVRDQGERDSLLHQMTTLADETKKEKGLDCIWSCAVLRECNDVRLSTLWIRSKSIDNFEAFQRSSLFHQFNQDIAPIVEKVELHNSIVFAGHLGKKPDISF